MRLNSVNLESHSFTYSLREKCPNTEFFLVRIFLYSVQIQENTDQDKLRICKEFCIWTLFTQWFLVCFLLITVILELQAENSSDIKSQYQ